VVIYAVLAVAYLATTPPARLGSHSPYNHYALQAEAWLDGRLDLAGPPPRYTGNNDFAVYQGRTFVSFPPVPALVLVPAVAAAGQVERVRDVLVFVLLAPLGPALFFVALERLRAGGRSSRSEREHVAFALLLGLGTVYWFSAVQGSVWFAAHVVAMALLAGFLACALDAAHPALAGALLALAFGTRPTTALAGLLFLAEVRRVHTGPALARALAAFAAPAALIVAVILWHNHARFGALSEFGHHHLTVVWRERIDTWGLFSFHYLGRNLAVVLTGLPFYSAGRGLQINGHGLALWLTTPIYLYALWPRRTSPLYVSCALAAGAILLVDLCYQNSGWLQFGYRFSNDCAPLLLLLVAIGGRRLGPGFWALAAWGVLVNAFGAATFDRPAHAHRYFVDGTQRILHQPD
jgi:hypothetical protein